MPNSRTPSNPALTGELLFIPGMGAFLALPLAFLLLHLYRRAVIRRRSGNLHPAKKQTGLLC